jgi:glutathione S-transferase
MTAPYRLMTIGPSHYCEKARWALDFFDVGYTEDAHPPIVHWWWSLRSGGGRTVPILLTGERVIGDSTEIVRFLDTKHGNGRRLYPVNRGRRKKVEEFEELFGTRLGPHTRRLVYHHLLPNRRLALAALEPGVGSLQRVIFRLGFPVFRWMMLKAMNINPISAGRSRERVEGVFSAVGARLAEGRSFLVGNDFTAADLSFASLAAPVVLPSKYGAPLPKKDELPNEIIELVRSFRATPAGEYARRLYEDFR